jgi:hypothetical protein
VKKKFNNDQERRVHRDTGSFKQLQWKRRQAERGQPKRRGYDDKNQSFAASGPPTIATIKAG